jgi:hypothetical protein
MGTPAIAGNARCEPRPAQFVRLDHRRTAGLLSRDAQLAPLGQRDRGQPLRAPSQGSATKLASRLRKNRMVVAEHPRAV